MNGVTARAALAGCAALALLSVGACDAGGGSPDAGGAANVPVTGPTVSPVPMQSVRVSVPAAMRTAPFDTARTVQLPSGWRMSVWARVPGARLEAWTPDGRLLVSRPGSGDVVSLSPRGSGTPAQQTLVAGLRQPHGLAFNGNTLYVAESHQVDAYTYAAGRLSGRHVIIAGLPDSKSPQLHGQYAHALKTVVVGKDGSVYVSVGSTGNISAEDRTASPPRAVVLRWSPTTKKTSVFARGVRNGTALGFDPTGGLWTAMNNRDQLPYPFHRDYDSDAAGSDDYGKIIQAYVNDHPLEPVAKLTAGRDLGWPYCDPDPSVQAGTKGSALAFAARPFVDDPDTNPTGAKLNCAALPRIEQGLPAHSAPLGLTFTSLPGPLGTGAMVASHGSWNRTPPQPPSVTFFPWRNGQLGNATPLVTGFQDGDGSRWGRAVDIVVGPDHALYLSDDQAGAVYRITTG
jgi:glucose/arabinose dehydrogenase